MIAFARKRLPGALLVLAVVGLALPYGFAADGSAFTEPGITGTSADFANCPADIVVSLELAKCVHSYATGGMVQIGRSTVPISVPGDTLDLGTGGEGSPVISPLHGILNGPAQPVPGGLLGAVGNIQLTGVTAKLEWATSVPPKTTFGTATRCGSNPFTTFDICRLTSANTGTATTLSVKIHLISPFLGSVCYIGSATHPIVIALTTGATNPPPPAHPIEGKGVEFLRQSGQLHLEESIGLRLVNNTFSVPVASGCGVSGGDLVNASINHKLGLPSPSGRNTIVVNAIGELMPPAGVLEHGWTGQ